jgi:hypothetical protein
MFACCLLLHPGVGMSHLTGEVKQLVSTLTKYDQDNYPEMLGRICIINAPFVFKAIWSLVKPLLNPRTLSKIQVGGQPHATVLRPGCSRPHAIVVVYSRRSMKLYQQGRKSSQADLSTGLHEPPCRSASTGCKSANQRT